jgi:hypothetical protein
MRTVGGVTRQSGVGGGVTSEAGGDVVGGVAYDGETMPEVSMVEGGAGSAGSS